jgi:hypothetical protein
MFIGYLAGRSNTIGTQNTFFGFCTGTTNTSDNYNTFLGYNAGYSNTAGVSNVLLVIARVIMRPAQISCISTTCKRTAP